MNIKSKRIMWILIILLLFLAVEIIFRHRSFINSLANELFRFGRYESVEKLWDKHNKEEDPVSNANLAKARYKQGKYDEAKDAMEKALKQDEDSADLLYDMGNIAFEKEDYQAAVEYYREALLKDPDDEDIKANLELALRKLDENPPPPQPKKEDQDGTKQDETESDQYQNILEALDNLEAQVRQNRSHTSPPKADNWW
nr:hypothetical protein [Candidatus Cloacimonadota bacterium]